MLIDCDDLHGLSGLIAVVGGGMTASMENGDRVGIFRLEFWDKAKWNSGACDYAWSHLTLIMNGALVGGSVESGYQTGGSGVGVYTRSMWGLVSSDWEVGAWIVIICGQVEREFGYVELVELHGVWVELAVSLGLGVFVLILDTQMGMVLQQLVLVVIILSRMVRLHGN